MNSQLLRLVRIVPILLAAGVASVQPAGATDQGASVKTGVDAWALGDYGVAVKAWERPAAAGDPDAQFNLAQAYTLGRGVSQDLEKAENLFGKAAQRGHLPAADNYGLLLFQRGERARALPYVVAAAERGNPRAQYFLGIAHFNGDGVPRDWVRAYALTSLARQSGVTQATVALQQMDGYIPLEQRQQAAGLATELAEQAQSARARQMAAVDLGATDETQPRSGRTGPAVSSTTAVSPTHAVAAAETMAAGESPRTAGADYARPSAAVATAAPRAPIVSRPEAPRPPVVPIAKPTASPGIWRVQLGAFAVSGNADALWNRLKSRPELAGKTRMLVPAGRVTKLQASGFASQAEAQTACTRLSAAGQNCLVTRN